MVELDLEVFLEFVLVPGEVLLEDLRVSSTSSKSYRGRLVSRKAGFETYKLSVKGFWAQKIYSLPRNVKDNQWTKRLLLFLRSRLLSVCALDFEPLKCNGTFDSLSAGPAPPVLPSWAPFCAHMYS